MLALAGALAATGCDGGVGGPARHVLLVSIDSLRADHLGCYGNPRDTSPRLDALAAGGTRFARAYAPSSWTLPSHATLLTGTSQRTHGAVTPQLRIADGVPMLATRLRKAGFRTRGVHSGPFLGAFYGFDRGFESYESCQSNGAATGPAANLASHADRTNPCLQETFARWVANAAADDRYFWFVHMWDPHYDYIPPADYIRRFDPSYRGTLDGRNIHQDGFPPHASKRDVAHLRARYDGEVRYTDDTIAAMLATLETAGLLADTLVVVTADHGEEFRDHGGKGHFRTVFAEVAAVPLLFWGPGVPRAHVVEEPVGLVDVAPTVLDLVGAPTAHVAGMEGESLLGRMRGDSAQVRPVVSVLYDPVPRRQVSVKAIAIRSSELTLLRPAPDQPWVAYDPVRDTVEQAPLLVRDEALLEQAEAALAAAALPETQAGPPPGEQQLPGDLEKRLRSLGYLE